METQIQKNKYYEKLKKILAVSDNIQFLYTVYNEFLFRNPDEIGKNYYLKKIIDDKSKINIMIDILNSGEAKAIKSNQIYQELLYELQPFSTKILKNIKKILNFGCHNDNSKDYEIDKNTYFNIVNQDSLFYQKNDEYKKNSGVNNIWFDLTTSMQWQGGVVGIVRAELEVARNLSKIDPNIKFSMLWNNGFVELDRKDLTWLLESNNVVDAYLTFFNRIEKNKSTNKELINIFTPENQKDFFYPYKDYDIVFSMGWMDSNKENIFTKVKVAKPNIYLVYLVYDTILLLDSTKYFYSPESRNKFKTYFKWLTYQCDFIFCGGRSTQDDVGFFQNYYNWPLKHSIPIKFGNDLSIQKLNFDKKKIFEKLNVKPQYILSVGTIEPRKNYNILYKAYLILLEKYPDNLPQLVICGKPSSNVHDLLDIIERNPALENNLLILTPSDLELALLYENCLYTVLPSFYEGWSLTLPESLSYGKLCICSDVKPLREIGQDFVPYVHPLDSKQWATVMETYIFNKDILKLAEESIQREWQNTTWFDCANYLYEHIHHYVHSFPPTAIGYPEVWFDLTTSYLHVAGVMSGIIRVELFYAKYLNEIYPNVHYFASANNVLFEIDKNNLSWLFDNDDITSAYKYFYDFWHKHELNNNGNRIPFYGKNVKLEPHSSILEKFADNSIIFLVNIDWDLAWTPLVVNLASQSKNVVVAQFIHDLTPIVVPHLHQKTTCEKFEPFFEYCSNNLNYLQYGGQTAELDGIKVQNNMKWNIPLSDYIKLASDFTNNILTNEDNDKVILESFGINKEFIITVGTIEPRKNHDILYRAYLWLFDQGIFDLPLMLFVGKPGWNSSDLMYLLKSDERIRNYIKVISPNDQQLDILYRKCKFCLLPSYYEGYSLTLNECLGYTKFCLTSRTPPLMEVGREFVEYIDPLDVSGWANAINLYANDHKLLSMKENYIKENWNLISWKNSALSLLMTAQAAQQKIFDKDD